MTRLLTDYAEHPWLKPSDTEVNHCDTCQTRLASDAIVWLDQDSGQTWGLPGSFAGDTLGCVAFCVTCARRALGTKRGRGRPKAKRKALQIQLWLSGDRADKVRTLAKITGETPQEVIRRMIDKATVR